MATQSNIVGSHLVFNGTNYAAWRARTRVEIRYGLNAASSIEPIPDGENAAATTLREEGERKAMAAIFARLGDNIVLQVRDCISPRAVFEQLDLAYAKTNTINALAIEDELSQMVLDSRVDPHEFFGKVDELITSLIDCGREVTDGERAQRYLRTLPRSMLSVRQTCASLLSIENYTSAHVRSTILREWAHYKSTRRDDWQQRSRGYSGTNQLKQNTDQNSNGRNGNGGNGSRKCSGQNQSASSSGGSQSGSGAGNGSEETQVACQARFKKSGYKGKKFDVKKVKCYKCGEKGHYANDCRTANLAYVSSDDESDLFANMVRKEVSAEEAEPTSNDRTMEFMGDSGANRHIICEREEKLINAREVTGNAATIRLARKGLCMTATKIGDLPILSEVDGEEVRGVLTNVMYVPDAGRNFLSTLRYMQNGYSTASSNGKYSIFNPSGKKIMLGDIIDEKITFKFKIRDRANNLNLDTNNLGPEASNSEACVMSALGSIWHGRFGHMCSKFVEKLPEVVIGVPKVKVNEDTTTCKICAEAKFKKLKHNSVRNRAKRILELIHLDIMGRICPASQDGHQYILVIIDDWSHFTNISNLKTKDEAPEFIKKFIIKVNNLFDHNVVNVRCDNALEFINNNLKNFFDQNGITLDLVPPRSPQLNSVVERMNGTLANRIRALLFHAECPIEWWHFAAEASAYLINRSPTSALELRTAYERWYGRKPDVTKLRTFGSVARVIVPEQNRRKFDKRAWSGILIGQTDMGSKVYDVRSRKVVISPEVRVDESKKIGDLMPSLKEKNFKGLKIEPKYIDSNIGRIEIRGSEANMLQSELTYSDAISGEDAVEWKKAIEYEFDMMKERNVWTLVPRPSGSIMDTKWVLKKQSKPDGVRYRARLCARGFKDKNIYDISETYSPTVKLPTVRLLLVLALENGWEVTHLDVFSAFLYGDMKRDVVISIPEGMNVDREKFALKLDKALYGLKVSSNTWYCKVKEMLQFENYDPMVTEPSVYVNKRRPTRCIMLVFVDDILITGCDPKECERMTRYLEKKVQVNNLGRPRKFLGISVIYENDRILLKQDEYISESCEEFQIGAMRSKTPMEKDLRVERQKEYNVNLPLQEILGKLMYACLGTRPDATYATNYLSRFQSTPTKELVRYGKRVLSYLLRTKDRGIWLKKSEKDQNVLTVFCDASFASDMDRKSTTGLVLKYGENTFHWRTLKQKCVTKSSTEAEYMALSSADTEVRIYSNFLNELKVDHRVVLKTDNSAAVDIAYRRDSRNCRHIDVAYRAIEESLAVGRIDKLVHIPGEINDADLLTKSVGYNRHELLCNNIMN